MTSSSDPNFAIDALAELLAQSDPAAARERARALLAIHPNVAELWRLSAIASLQLGNYAEADMALLRALELQPDLIEAWCNRASLQAMHGELAAAEATLQHALKLAPGHAAALNNLGRLRHQRGDYAGAAHCFEHCLRMQPDYIDAWLNFANTRLAQFRLSDAETCARHALNLDTRSPDGWYLLGYLFERQGKLRDAAAAYHASMDLRPLARTAHNLGLVLDQIGDWQGAAKILERALQLEPDQQQSLAQLVFVKRRLCDWHGLAALAAKLVAAVDTRAEGITPFSFLAETATPAQQLQCARTFARQFGNTDIKNAHAMSMTKVRAHDVAEANIRVGFVSSGFAEHATGLLVVELIENLRNSPLTTIGFATTADDRSEIRRRLVASFDEFHDVSERSPDAIAQQIVDRQCDVLIDIDGYCMNSVPQVFAKRPAPIIVNWLAYPGSLGAPWYDYLIADRHVISTAQREFYDEKIAWLPRCYQPSDTTRIVAEPPSRPNCGLPQSGFIYCCFNNSWKFSPQSFARWMRILQAVPDSVLWLLDGPAGNGIAERLRHAAQRAGIDPQRLVFSPKLKHADYLARYRHADLLLDTNPYNAHTTASDALYAGCPVLTNPGDAFASRVAGSLNHQLGLDELNVGDDDAYVALAIELARQPERLAALRARLHDPENRARLFDMRAYADDFAQLLLAMAKRRQHGHAPADLDLV